MNQREQDAVLGALTADAAALGLHWIYDTARIRDVVGSGAPEFVTPDIDNYRKTQAYFAHAGKRVGDSSHYGAQAMVALRSLCACDGALDIADYDRRYVAAFGPGGTWVGYIDYATRETLHAIDAAGRAALEAARDFDLGEHENERALIQAKVMANAGRWQGPELDRAMERAVHITHPGNAALVRTAQAMAHSVVKARAGPHGSDDVQLPAVSSLPALGAALDAARVESAVRITHHNDEAVRWAETCAAMLRAAHAGATCREVAEAADQPAFEEYATAAEAVQKHGTACNLDAAVPLMTVLLRDAADFKSTIRQNILLGGDSSGRGILLGAVLALCFGVPDDWLKRTHAAREAERLFA